jgi:hypothetical protein
VEESAGAAVDWGTDQVAARSGRSSMAAGHRLDQGGGRPSWVVLLTAAVGQLQERARACGGRVEEQARRLHERENRYESGATDTGTSA